MRKFLAISFITAVLAAPLVAWSSVSASHGEPGTLDTIAGAGTSLDDGIPGTESLIPLALGIAATPDGRVFIADMMQCTIRKIEADIITTVAGTPGSCGYSGDGGPAVHAQLGDRTSIALDAAGNMFIADTFNCAIRRVDAMSAVITQVAGTGCEGVIGVDVEVPFPAQIAVDADGVVYFSEGFDCQVNMVSGGVVSRVTGLRGDCTPSGDGGAAIDGRMTWPAGLAAGDDGALYIADYWGCTIRLIAGGLISTVAGNGSCGFNNDGTALSISLNHPHGLALDAHGGLLIADLDNCLIRRLSEGQVTTLAGYTDILDEDTSVVHCGYNGDDRPALGAMLVSTVSVAADASGNVYFSEADELGEFAARVRIVHSAFVGAPTPEPTASPTPAPPAATHTPAEVKTPGSTATPPATTPTSLPAETSSDPPASGVELGDAGDRQAAPRALPAAGDAPMRSQSLARIAAPLLLLIGSALLATASRVRYKSQR